MSAFNNMVSLARDRNWGGTANTVACEPYVSGYSFIKFLHVPKGLTTTHSAASLGTIVNHPKMETNHTTTAAENEKLIAQHLEHAMNSVTPPGGTINKIEIQGLGGSKWAVPGAMDYGNSISIKYLEFSGLPITRIHRSWASLIRDNRMGLTHLNNQQAAQAGDKNTSYNKNNYGATMAYWTTKPDGITVEFAAIYTGMFPTKDPMDLYSGDITSIDKLEIEIEYNVDMIYNDDKVFEACQDWAKNGMAGTDTAGLTEWGGTTGKWTQGYRGGEENNAVVYR